MGDVSVVRPDHQSMRAPPEYGISGTSAERGDEMELRTWHISFFASKKSDRRRLIQQAHKLTTVSFHQRQWGAITLADLRSLTSRRDWGTQASLWFDSIPTEPNPAGKI